VRGGARASEEGQGWTKSMPNFSMGSNLSAAHKVFVEMAEREKVSNFGNSLGGYQSYIHRDGMVVVGFILEKNCKMAKVR
jgi:hypothetical protein